MPETASENNDEWEESEKITSRARNGGEKKTDKEREKEGEGAGEEEESRQRSGWPCASQEHVLLISWRKSLKFATE